MGEAVPEFGQKAAFAEDAVEGAGHRDALRDVCKLRDEANDVETQLLFGLILEEVVGISDGDGRTLGPLQELLGVCEKLECVGPHAEMQGDHFLRLAKD